MLFSNSIISNGRVCISYVVYVYIHPFDKQSQQLNHVLKTEADLQSMRKFGSDSNTIFTVIMTLSQVLERNTLI